MRAGSIVPLGPDQEWSTEKAEDPIELRIYAGADGDFTLYEDENDTYNYEKGAYATIPMHWDDAASHADHRRPQRPISGNAGKPNFRVVFVRENHGVGANASDEADKVVRYSGKQITVTP